MALTANQNWYVRAGGAELNGGGYDASITSPGTNYADQDSAQVTFNGTTVTATTSGTSATILITGYTVAATDVANTLRLASGTNYTAGYYTIVSVDTGLGTWTLDRNCSSGAGAALVGRMGGAHHMPWVYANGGGGTQPAITTPLAAGHTVNIRGNGGSPDYNLAGAAGWYWTFPVGSITVGKILFKGYGTRPLIHYTGLFHYQTNYWQIENISFKMISATYSSTWGMCSGGSHNIVHNCILDQNGLDAALMLGSSTGLSMGMVITESEFKNTGSTTAGSVPAIGSVILSYGIRIENCYIHGIRGPGLQVDSSWLCTVRSNVIADCKSDGILVSGTTTHFAGLIENNTIYNNAGHGINFNAIAPLNNFTVRNNIISKQDQSGKYGINIAAGTAASNELFIRGRFNYNNFFGNTADRNAVSAGANDQALDPQFTNAGAADFSIGLNLKALGYPSLIGLVTTTTSYQDIGAAQRKEDVGRGAPPMLVQGGNRIGDM